MIWKEGSADMNITKGKKRVGTVWFSFSGSAMMWASPDAGAAGRNGN